MPEDSLNTIVMASLPRADLSLKSKMRLRTVLIGLLDASEALATKKWNDYSYLSLNFLL
jgi:hypothetical protein